MNFKDENVFGSDNIFSSFFQRKKYACAWMTKYEYLIFSFRLSNLPGGKIYVRTNEKWYCKHFLKLCLHLSSEEVI